VAPSCSIHDDLTPNEGWLGDLVAEALAAGEDIPTALDIARRYGTRLALPAGGRTAARWGVLSALGRANLTVARVFEAHTDALAILAEAGIDTADALTWGVFAAEAPGQAVAARVAPDGSVTLTGTKPWCSLGGVLDAALVTAHVGDARQLFRVDLRHPSVRAHPVEGWVARGLRTVVSAPIEFEGSPAEPVGEASWYLVRPGFAWGGIGVAACWHGGALGVADAVARAAAKRPGELSAMHLGSVDVALHGARTALLDAARHVDAGTVDDPAVLALRVRSVVADAVERVLRQAGHALGPAPLGFDARHAARVADLELYVRQHHAERDLADLGSRLVAGAQ
jgi:alkylation response protein AidB-like acyl-CoA dehydrogenase